MSDNFRGTPTNDHVILLTQTVVGFGIGGSVGSAEFLHWTEPSKKSNNLRGTPTNDDVVNQDSCRIQKWGFCGFCRVLMLNRALKKVKQFSGHTNLMWWTRTVVRFGYARQLRNIIGNYYWNYSESKKAAPGPNRCALLTGRSAIRSGRSMRSFHCRENMWVVCQPKSRRSLRQ